MAKSSRNFDGSGMPDGFGMPDGVKKVSSKELSESVALNKETIYALQAIGKDINTLVYHQDNNFKQYTDKVKDLVEEQQRTEQIKAEEKKATEETLKQLIKQISQDTGIQQKEIAASLEDVENEMFTNLPKDMQDKLSTLLKDDKNALSKLLGTKDSATKKFFSNMLEKLDDTLSKNSDILKSSILGPITLLTAPLEEFFGFDLFGAGQNLVKSIFKRKPTRGDVAKTGDMGSLYITDTLRDIFGGKKSTKKEGGLLDNVLGKGGIGGAGGLAGILKTALPIAAIAAGIIWMAIDAIRGVLKAGQWKTSKVSAGIGGALGGMDSGFAGAFKNMGKFALIGAGIGSLIAPVVGTLAGGLIGAAVGAIFGYIGGAKIAQGLDNVKKDLATAWKAPITEKFTNVVDVLIKSFVNGTTYVISMIPKMILSLFIKDKKKLEDITKVLQEGFKFAFLPLSWLGNIIKTIGKSLTGMVTAVKKIFKGDPVGGLIDLVKGSFRILLSPWEGIFQTFKENKITQSIGLFFKGIFVKIAKWFGTTIITKIKDGFLKLFDNVKQFFANLDPKTWLPKIGEGIQNVVGGISSYWKNLTGGTSSSSSSAGGKSVQDAIIKSDGTIIRTHPEDNIIATKNIPAINPSMLSSYTRNQTTNTYENLNNNNSQNIISMNEAKLDIMIELLKQLVGKEVTIQLPKQTMSDLDMLISGQAL